MIDNFLQEPFLALKAKYLFDNNYNCVSVSAFSGDFCNLIEWEILCDLVCSQVRCD